MAEGVVTAWTCPRCGSDDSETFLDGCDYLGPPSASDPWHADLHRPAPGSSSPDTATLTAELRQLAARGRFPDDYAEIDLDPDDKRNLRAAADALEAQAARITELEAAMRLVVTGGEAEHRPMWSDRSAPGFTETPQEGLDPVGCVVCYPADGDWPCDIRMDINDLRAALDGTRHPRQETPE